jgi:hypothetical protein
MVLFNPDVTRIGRSGSRVFASDPDKWTKAVVIRSNGCDHFVG